jgi:hypothetical protein
VFLLDDGFCIQVERSRNLLQTKLEFGLDRVKDIFFVMYELFKVGLLKKNNLEKINLHFESRQKRERERERKRDRQTERDRRENLTHLCTHSTLLIFMKET